jgi:Zn-dependent alcohol dehydrogenase
MSEQTSQRINAALTLDVVGAVSNGGLIRLTTVAESRQLRTGDRVIVSGVGGVPNATGTWTVTTISATVTDLQGSTFAGTFTSGGTIRRTGSA